MTELDLKFSYSQINIWNSCRLKWYFKYVLGMDTREKSEALRKGTVAHEFAAHHYEGAKEVGFFNERLLLDNHVNFLRERSQDISDVEDMKIVSQMGPLFKRYITEFSMLKDKQYEVLEVEKHFELPVDLPSGEEVTFQMFLDLLVKDKETGYIWLMDHKTHTSRPWSKSKTIMDAQLPIYMAILRAHGIDVFGVIYNLINVYDYKNPAPTEKLFKREETFRTPIEVDTVLNEAKKAIQDILDNWENPRRSQDADQCSRCWFQDPCLMLMKGFGPEEAFDPSVYTQGEVNPYYEATASE